jgi:hypothetical protein
MRFSHASHESSSLHPEEPPREKSACPRGEKDTRSVSVPARVTQLARSLARSLARAALFLFHPSRNYDAPSAMRGLVRNIARHA